MQMIPLQMRIALLALAAALVGVLALTLDSARHGAASAAAPATYADLVPNTATVATDSTASAPGELVAAQRDAALAAGAAAPATPAPATPAPVTPAPAPATPPAPAPTPTTTAPTTRGGVDCTAAHQIVTVPRDLVLRTRPNGAWLGTLPARSHYLGRSMVAWVQQVSADGRWGEVTIPWSKPVARTGWVSLAGLPTRSTNVLVVGDVSARTMHVYRGCTELFSAPMAVGAAGSPSPRGRFWVTDPVAVPSSQPYFGSYAFGLSTVQPHPPAGWSGGNQMAIHGTNDPGSIGTAVSAGCLRVGEGTLARLREVLVPGTPVVISD